MTRTSSVPILSAALATTLLLTACGQAGQDPSDGDGSPSGAGDPVEISMWTHSAGNPAEIVIYDRIISDFNASQGDYEVVRQDFPQASYNDSVVAASAAGDLPCLLDMDGPIMPNWAWAGFLQPLGLPSELTDSLLPTAVGMYEDEVYSAGYWDAALAIFARESVLEANDIRIPEIDSPWSLEEFDSALQTLQDAGYETPLDIGAEDVGEWWPYAYSPMLQSFGGDLIDRSEFLTAEGALNGPEAVAFGEWFQSAFFHGWISNSGTIGNQEFVDDEVALAYTGSWNAQAAIEAIGDDLLILPPPDFGNGPAIGGGSWQWGISAHCADVEGARAYLEFSFDDEYIAAFADGQYVIPATAGGEELSANFGPDGVMRPFAELSQRYAIARPETPAYAVISSVFEIAMNDIMNSADVQQALDRAVSEIDADIASNDGYRN